ncbi:MAG: hypothetical protein ABIP38_13760 [Steroidobacteraceae bacterium]
MAKKAGTPLEHESHETANDKKAGLKGDVAKLDGDFSPQPYEQDTPGRVKTAGSRQQTQPNQQSATGSAELDRKAAKK